MSQNQPLLQAIDLKKHYPVKKGLFAPERLVKALDGVSFTLERGKTLAVVGESGCGKSTLGRLLTMIEVPTGGELYYQGQDLLKPDVSAEKLRRQKIQIVFQNPYGSLNPRKKVGQILEEPLLINTSLSAAERREKALEMMAKVGLKTEHYDRYPHMFSGGQRQRLVLVAVFGPSIVNASLALTFVALPHYVRLTRAAVLVEVNRDYVTASRVAGAGALRQMFVNILPNCLAPLIVQASLGFSNAILDMAALGFLGMGAQPPTPEWGTMLSDVLQFAQSAWWVVTFPGVAILLTVLAFNLMGDGLRDALDPKLKQ